MTPPNSPAALSERFAWALTQDRIDLVVSALTKLEAFLDLASPGTVAAENVARLLTDLRAQCVTAGADDPYPHRPMFPSFEDTVLPAWTTEMERAHDA